MSDIHEQQRRSQLDSCRQLAAYTPHANSANINMLAVATFSLADIFANVPSKHVPLETIILGFCTAYTVVIGLKKREQLLVLLKFC